jgi:hypothetical protein
MKQRLKRKKNKINSEFFEDNQKLQTFSYINQEKQKIQLNKIREEKRRY